MRTALLALTLLMPQERPDDDPLPTGASLRLGSNILRHRGARGVAFTRDGKALVSGGGFGPVRIWEVPTGKLARAIGEERWAVSSIAVSPDGRQLAAAFWGRDNFVRLLDFESGKELCALEGHAKQVASVAYAPDGKHVATAGYDGTARIWDAQTGKEIHKLTGHDKDVRTVAFSPDGKTLASGGRDKTARLWDVESGKEIRRIDHPDGGGVIQVSFSPNGKTLASAGDSGSIRLWDPSTGKELQKLGEIGTFSLAFSPDGALIASGHYDGTARVWNLKTGETRQTLKTSGGNVHAVSFSPDGARLAATTANALHLWDAASGRELAATDGHKGPVRTVAFSPDGKRLASADDEFAVRLWDLATGRTSSILQTAEGERFGMRDLHSVAFSPDGASVAAAGDGPVVWDVASGTPLFKKHADISFGVAFSPDGTKLAAGMEKSIRLYEMPMGKELARLEGHTDHHIRALVFSPDGRVLFSVCDDRTIRAWDVAQAKEVLQLPSPAPHTGALACSPDGALLAVAGFNGPVLFVELASGKVVARLEGHTGNVHSIAFSPDGRTIATGSWDKTARLWDVATGKETHCFREHNDHVLAVAFSPDGKSLATGLQRGTILLWGAPAAKALGPATRDLETLWDDLAGEPEKGNAAAWALVAAGDRAVALLKEKLKAPSVGPKMIEELVTQLDAEELAARERAASELRKVADETLLRKTLESSLSREARSRVESILAEAAHPVLRTGEALRRSRALRVLIRLGSREGVETAAAGARTAREKEEAAAVVETVKGGGRLPARPPGARVLPEKPKKPTAEELRARLSPKLLQAMPGVEKRLADASADNWTKIYYEAMALPGLRRRDVEGLYLETLRAVEGSEHQSEFCLEAMNHGFRSAVPALMVLAQREDEDPFHSGRGDAIWVLGELGVEEAIPVMIKALKGDDVMALHQATTALSDLQAVEAIPELRKILRSTDEKVSRQSVPTALAELGDRESIPEFLKLLDDPDEQTRGAAALALGMLRVTEAVPKILPLLKSGTRGNVMQWNAAHALGQTGSREAVPGLLKYLESDSAQDRYFAAYALGKLGAREAVPKLLACLKDRDPMVRQYAVNALSDLEEKEAAPAITALLKDEVPNTRVAAAWALAELRAPEASPALRQLLAEKDVHARCRGMMGLAKLRDSAAVPELIEGLSDAKWEVRWSALEALAGLATPEALSKAAERLKDDHPRVRSAAASLLCSFGAQEGVPVLIDNWATRSRLDALNGVRSPHLWSRMRALSIQGPLEGNGKEIIERIAREAGLKVEFSDSLNRKERAWLSKRQTNRRPGNLIEALRVALNDGLEAIVEADRLRILSREAASDFWEQWAEQRK